MSRRVYLCGMTGPGEEANLRALVDPIRPYVDGLQFCFHWPHDLGADYLEGQAGTGRIVYAHYTQRHFNSLNQYLWQGTLEDGDVIIQLDTLERLSEAFCRDHLPVLINQMEQTRVVVIANYGKPLVIRFNEQLEYRGSPHWYVTNADGGMANLELPKDLFWNVRAEQRDLYHWVTHYARYMLMPAGSNHAQLGLDHHPGDQATVFRVREAKRLEFRRQMRARGFPLTLDGLKVMLSQPLDAPLKALINSDKVWSDYYHYTILGDHSVLDSHKPSDMKVVT